MENNSFGWLVSFIAGIIIAIILEQPFTAKLTISPIIIGIIAIVAVLIGFYVDYNALFEYRDEEPVLVRSLVFNVVSLIGGVVLTILFLVFGKV